MDFSSPDLTSNNPEEKDEDSEKETNKTDQLSSIFDLLDLEGNGDLDFAEFKIGLNSIGVNLSHDESLTLYDAIDSESSVPNFAIFRNTQRIQTHILINIYQRKAT